jgi:gluconolactonase
MNFRALLASLVILILLTASAATPAMAQILPPGATPTKLTPASVGGIAIVFTEGALYDGNGGVYFSDLHAANAPTTNPSRILHYDIASGTTAVADALSGGANGMYRDTSGLIYTADRDGGKPGQTRQISRRSAADISMVDAALATNFNGTIFNGPNDLVVDAKGGIYFTDPDYDGRLQTKAVYYLNPQGSLTRILTGFNNPNGIILSPNGKTLYVAIEGERRILAYDVSQDENTFGAISNQRQFASMGTTNSPDGITIDPAGDVYAAGNNSVWAWNPAGQKLFQLNMPAAPSVEDPTNLDFGGADGKTLFITAGKSLYGVHLNIATPKTGDYNGNGVVDAADYTVWRDTFGSTTNFAADGNGDHVIDQADYDVWLGKFPVTFGSATTTSGSSVPEPSTLTLAALALLLVTFRRLHSIINQTGANRENGGPIFSVPSVIS